MNISIYLNIISPATFRKLNTFGRAMSAMGDKWVDELKNHVQRIRDIQRDIDADEKRLGYHASYEEDGEDLKQQAAAAVAQQKLNRFIKKHEHLKPKQMHWADYIHKLAQQNRRKELARKRAALSSNYDLWGNPKFDFLNGNPNQKK